MGGLWVMFCGDEGNSGEKLSGFSLLLLRQPNSCINQASIVFINILLIALLFLTLTKKSSSTTDNFSLRFRDFSRLHVASIVFNVLLGILYLGFGVWSLQDKLRKNSTALPFKRWLLPLFQGFTWSSVALTINFGRRHLLRMLLHLLSILAFLLALFVCVLTVITAVEGKRVTVKIVVDALSLPGAILLLLCAFKAYNDEEVEKNEKKRDAPPNAREGCVFQVTSFAEAGLLSRMSFWWLNPLMKKGSEHPLQDQDIPELRQEDRAESCYLQFSEQIKKQKQAETLSHPSMLRTIILCHWKEILVSGFFAFIKIVILTAGPMLLNAFILVAEGKSGFKHEGYILAFTLFISKSIESFAQRQWYFRCRLIGLKVRSLLIAAIYDKQLRLSNEGRLMHSSGKITNYVTVDAYRIGEFPFWFHQTWTTSLQLCLSILILFRAVRLATFAALMAVLMTLFSNSPIARLQNKVLRNLMVAQDERLKASTEALVNMKVLKLYAWENHFKNVIENLRKMEYKWLSVTQCCRAYNNFIFWSSPLFVSAATFGACYFLKIPLHANNVFTFVATLSILQDPVRSVPEVIRTVIQTKVAFARILKFLDAPELMTDIIRHNQNNGGVTPAILIKSANFSWEENPSKPTLWNVNLEVRLGEMVAVCGEVGSGKSTLLTAILGEVPSTQGTVQVSGRVGYVSQTAWIQSGTIQDNILFGSEMDSQRYKDTLERCSLMKDLELLPHGDQTLIGERGINLSGGQKQRVQLARALYKDADIYLLDDPLSALDAETATTIFKEYVVGALSRKAVVLVTHQVDFLPAFDSILLMSEGEIIAAAPYDKLLAESLEFQELVNAHKETAGSDRLCVAAATKIKGSSSREIEKANVEYQHKASQGDQLIKQEEKEVGDRGFKAYIQYMNQKKGYLYFTLAALSHFIFISGLIAQNAWMAASVNNTHVGTSRLIAVYLIIGCVSALAFLCRSIFTVVLGVQSAKSLFFQLINSLFRAPVSFYDSTPIGRILSRVSSDLSLVDLDLSFDLLTAVGSTLNTCANLGVLSVVTWQALFVSIPVVYVALQLQRYYFSTAKELMRINGTTNSLLASHLAESVAGAMTIRAFKQEERFFGKNLDLIDKNASPYFLNFTATEWLIQRLELVTATVLASAALCMTLLPPGTFGSGFIGLAISYGLALNSSLVMSIQKQCTLENHIISVERLDQYMHISSEAPEIVEDNRPPLNWPSEGRVDICDLQIRYRPDTPLVLRGISCTIGGGHKIGIVGRTGSGKTTLISALFRLMEPAGGKIVVDGIDISKIRLHDLRSRFGIIPQDPTLFNGTVRYNLDPLCQYTDQEIWEVLEKCQLQETIQEKEEGLSSLVVEDGSNWSMGQRQLFCLGRVLLRRSRLLVLDEATASIDNATDLILQKTIRTEFADSTVITVAHRIPTVMDCSMILAMRDGNVAEYDEPQKLMRMEDSLFSQLVKEYWSHFSSAESH